MKLPLAKYAVVAGAVVATGLVIWQLRSEDRAPEAVSPVARSEDGGVQRERPALPEPKKGAGPNSLVGRVEDATRTPLPQVVVSAQREVAPGPMADAAVGYDSEPEVVAVSAQDGRFQL
ncbi:MAG: hypothetical protein KJO07_25710, partial [Deltaproteobacteria bacterium]|nr:hypothetical protein [Deltaproteobacteria bacterium]